MFSDEIMISDDDPQSMIRFISLSNVLNVECGGVQWLGREELREKLYFAIFSSLMNFLVENSCVFKKPVERHNKA